MINQLKLKIPPPAYAVIFAFIMWIVQYYMPWSTIIHAPFTYLGLALIACAGISEAWSALLFLKAKTTINPLAPKNTSHLVVGGIYRYTRNPMYIGLTVVLTGLALFFGSWLNFTLIPLFIIVLTHMQIVPEEQLLLIKFGEPYQQYLNTVPRWLFINRK